jgi:hypothetical protein
LPSILTSQLAQAIAAVCIGSPQEGQDVERSLLAMSTILALVGIKSIKIWKKHKKSQFFCGLPIFRLLLGLCPGGPRCSLTVEMAAGRQRAIKSSRATGLTGLNVQAVIPAKPVLSSLEGAGIRILKLDSASRPALPVPSALEGSAAEWAHNDKL